MVDTSSVASPDIPEPQLTVADLRTLPPILTPMQAAKILGVGREVIYEALQNGTVPAVRVGSRWKIPTARLLSMLGIES